MKCPACGSEQPDGAIVCATCNAVIAEVPASPQDMLQASAPAAASEPEFTYVAAPDPPSPLKLAGAFAGLIAIAFALFLLFETSGGEVPDDAVRQDDMGYAVSAPRGWTVLTKETYSTLTKELAGRLPENFRKDLQQGRIHMGVMKIMPNGEFSPSVNVVVTDQEVPSLNEDQKDQAIKALTGVYKVLMRDFKLLGAGLTVTDELTSLKISMLGTLTLKTDPRSSPYGGGAQDLRLRFVQLLVPGNKRAYILTATSLELQFSTYERTFNQVFDSFRVIDRPPVFGALVTNALRVGLISAALYLLYFFVSGVVVWLRR